MPGGDPAELLVYGREEIPELARGRARRDGRRRRMVLRLHRAGIVRGHVPAELQDAPPCETLRRPAWEIIRRPATGRQERREPIRAGFRLLPTPGSCSPGADPGVRTERRRARLTPELRP